MKPLGSLVVPGLGLISFATRESWFVACAVAGVCVIGSIVVNDINRSEGLAEWLRGLVVPADAWQKYLSRRRVARDQRTSARLLAKQEQKRIKLETRRLTARQSRRFRK